MYAIVDIETTGGVARRNKVIEIAIAIHDGEKVVDSFETLINPETSIPPGITRLTGITQEMVLNAPKFYEIAKIIVEKTDKKIFVAHNVRFDYSFIKEEFRRLGFAYTRRQLCTVRLTRKAFPGLPSYSLSNLIKHFKLPCSSRHRAMGDVEATIVLFEKILAKEAGTAQVSDIVNLGIKEALLPKNISLEQLHALPDVCGVYYLHDEVGDIVYVGKSINIQKRVMEHFAKMTEKARKLQEKVNNISFEVTGSELVALLLESYEIKRLRPVVNRAQRRSYFPYVIYQYKDEQGYICFDISKPTASMRKGLQVIAEYPKTGSAKGYLKRAMDTFTLCPFLCNLERSSQPCFNYHLKKCAGACIQKEPPESYNERAEQAIEYLATIFEEDFFVIDRGRTATEKAIVLVEQGNYRGYGFLEEEDMTDIAALRDAIHTVQGNPETAKIIRRFLAGNHQAKVLPLS